MDFHWTRTVIYERTIENRRTLTPFQRQANHSNFRIIDSQCAVIMITSNSVLKSFRCTTKLILPNFFTFLLYKTNV